MRDMSKKTGGLFVLCTRLAGAALVALLVLLPSFQVHASEARLLFYHSELCEYCDKWKEDIGQYYDKTKEAETLPLRSVDVDEKLPDDIAHIKAVYFTPTFVVIQDGREVGRIVGYVDEGFFWGYLKPLVEKVQLAGAGAGQKSSSVSNLKTQQSPPCMTC